MTQFLQELKDNWRYAQVTAETKRIICEHVKVLCSAILSAAQRGDSSYDFTYSTEDRLFGEEEKKLINTEFFGLGLDFQHYIANADGRRVCVWGWSAPRGVDTWVAREPHRVYKAAIEKKLFEEEQDKRAEEGLEYLKSELVTASKNGSRNYVKVFSDCYIYYSVMPLIVKKLRALGLRVTGSTLRLEVWGWAD